MRQSQQTFRRRSKTTKTNTSFKYCTSQLHELQGEECGPPGDRDPAAQCAPPHTSSANRNTGGLYTLNHMQYLVINIVNHITVMIPQGGELNRGITWYASRAEIYEATIIIVVLYDLLCPIHP